MIAGLAQRILAPALGLGLAVAMLLAGWQWREAVAARGEVDKIGRTFAEYRETQERQTREALAAEIAKAARTAKLQQEARDAEYLARLAAQADADRLRAGAGQLQRYAQDLATSLRDRARDSAASSSSPAAGPADDLSAILLGRLDEAAEGVVLFADASRRAGQLCERSYDAVRP